MQTPASRLRAALRPRDVVAVLGVPAVLVAVFALPAPLRESFVFSPAAPSLVSAYATHFVHRSAGHLLGNLAVYGLAVPAAYLLAVLGDCRQVFFIPFVGVLIALPLVLSALHVLLGSSGQVVGFSGLNMAFVGMLPLFETVYLARLERDIRLDHAPALFFAGAAVVAARVVPPGDTRLVIVAGTTLVAVVYAGHVYRELSAAAIRNLLEHTGEFELVLGTVVVFFVAVFLAFPADPVRSGGVVDVYGHFLGYALGFVATFLAFRIDDPTLRPPRPPGEHSA